MKQSSWRLLLQWSSHCDRLFSVVQSTLWDFPSFQGGPNFWVSSWRNLWAKVWSVKCGAPLRGFVAARWCSGNSSLRFFPFSTVHSTEVPTSANTVTRTLLFRSASVDSLMSRVFLIRGVCIMPSASNKCVRKQLCCAAHSLTNVAYSATLVCKRRNSAKRQQARMRHRQSELFHCQRTRGAETGP